MNNNIFYEQLKKYNPSNIEEIKNAMKEVLQNIILCGLAKSDFFKYAVFYGGTSLRILRNLPRFSEDLDFTLIDSKDNFNFNDYLIYAKNEINSLMIECDIYEKEKNILSSVTSAFFRFNLKKLFEISYNEYSNKIINNELLSIKVEIEKNYFDGGDFEYKLLTYPSFCQIRTFNIETMFASKLIAVLNRKWKLRIKGRDFYDYLFYVSNKIKINMKFLENGLKKFSFLNEDEILTLDLLKIKLKDRFENVDFNEARKDVLPFIKNDDRFINAFNKEIFISSLDLLEEA